MEPNHGKIAPIILSVVGLILCGVAIVNLRPRLEPVTVQRQVTIHKPVIETKTQKHKINVNGKDIEVDVPVQVQHTVAETSLQTVTVEPTVHEKLWLWGMLIIAGFLGLFSLGTASVWFYFMVRKNGTAPAAITEMLKYLVASFMGIFVGFMGGSSIGSEKQASVEHPAAATAPPVSGTTP